MAPKIVDLCRLCAKKHEFSKELLDESNKNVADLIRQFTQITVNACDIMPTKVCLDCEEKLVSFQLFILDCYKVQNSLRQMCLENNIIKFENDIPEDQSNTEDTFNFKHPLLKSEVKYEFADENIIDKNITSAGKSITNDTTFCDSDGILNDDDDFDDLDNIAIASLKQVTKTITDPAEQKLKTKLNNVLQNPFFKVRDLVKTNCRKCRSKCKSWVQLASHYSEHHKNDEPLAYCLCGFEIRSKRVLYKHVSEHKIKSKKGRKSNQSRQSNSSELDTTNDNSVDQSIKDFINLECTICEKKCSSWYNLKSHSEKAHTISPVVKCLMCGLIIKSKSSMYKHVTDHKRRGAFSCDKCAAVKKSAAALSKHMMRHVPKTERKYNCDLCDKTFVNNQSLQSHAKSHIPINDRKVYHCEICNMRFTTRSSAASHKRVVHDKIKGFVCDLCGYSCGTNGELRQHRAIHSDDKPFVCRTCSKSFKTYSNLKTHMDTHEDTSYVCYVCSRVLNSRRTLRKHLLVHEDKLRHACTYCNKAFKRRQTLKVHMHMHTGDKPLSCKWCEEKFAYASTLRSHRLRCHPDKMASQALTTYNYTQQVAMPQDYIKSDLAAIGMSDTKNEVEAL